MNKKRPFIIEIEGVDGAGKATQANNLCRMLKLHGYNVKTYSFPMYNSNSSIFIKKYLAGEYNEMNLNPFQISSFFTLDRFLSWKKIQQECLNEEIDVIVFDRYIGSNLIYQGARVKIEMQDLNKRFAGSNDPFYDFIDKELEYEINQLKLPRADIVFFLGLPLYLSKQLRKDRLNKATGEEEQDINETDDKLLEMCISVGEGLSRYLQWNYIDCTNTDGSALKPINDITTELLNSVIKTKAIENYYL